MLRETDRREDQKIASLWGRDPLNTRMKDLQFTKKYNGVNTLPNRLRSSNNVLGSHSESGSKPSESAQSKSNERRSLNPDMLRGASLQNSSNPTHLNVGKKHMFYRPEEHGGTMRPRGKRPIIDSGDVSGSAMTPCKMKEGKGISYGLKAGGHGVKRLLQG